MEQWKVEAEKLSAVLTGVQEESEKIEKSLADQVAEKTSLVEQLKKAVSELQLEADNLRAQNLLLTTRMGDKSRSTLHVHALETACDNEASLRSTTTVTSATGGLVSDGSLTGEVVGEVVHRESNTRKSWLMRDPASTTTGGRPVTRVRSPTETMYNLKIASGLNMLATPFTAPYPRIGCWKCC